MNDFYNDISTAIIKLNITFQKHNLTPPAAIVLKKHEDMVPFHYYRDYMHGDYNDFANRGIVAKLCNVEIRFPENMIPEYIDRNRSLWPGLDHIANFLNTLDTEGMSVDRLRKIIYAECLWPKVAVKVFNNG